MLEPERFADAGEVEAEAYRLFLHGFTTRITEDSTPGDAVVAIKAAHDEALRYYRMACSDTYVCTTVRNTTNRRSPGCALEICAKFQSVDKLFYVKWSISRIPAPDFETVLRGTRKAVKSK